MTIRNTIKNKHFLAWLRVFVWLGVVGSTRAFGATPALFWRATGGDEWTLESRGRFEIDSMAYAWLVREGPAADRLRWTLISPFPHGAWTAGHLALPSGSRSASSVWSRDPSDRVRASLSSVPRGLSIDLAGARAGVAAAAARDSTGTRLWTRAEFGPVATYASESGVPTVRVDLPGDVPWTLRAGGDEARVSLRGGGGRVPWALRAEAGASSREIDVGAGVRVEDGPARGLRTELGILREESRASTRARAIFSRRGKQHHGVVDLDSRGSAGPRIEFELTTNHGAGWRSTVNVATDRRAACAIQRVSHRLSITGRLRLDRERARVGSATIAWRRARLGRVRLGFDWAAGERGVVECDWSPPWTGP